VQPDRIDAGFRRSKKSKCSKPSLSVDLRRLPDLVSICTSRSGTYVEQLDYLVGARLVSERHHW